MQPEEPGHIGRCFGAGAYYPNHFFLLTMARRRRAIAGLLNKEIGAELCVNPGSHMKRPHRRELYVVSSASIENLPASPGVGPGCSGYNFRANCHSLPRNCIQNEQP